MGVTTGKEIGHSDETLHLEKHSKIELSFFLLSSHARSKLKTIHKSIKFPGTGQYTVMRSKRRQSLITWPHCAFALILLLTVMNCAALLHPRICQCSRKQRLTGLISLFKMMSRVFGNKAKTNKAIMLSGCFYL